MKATKKLFNSINGNNNRNRRE